MLYPSLYPCFLYISINQTILLSLFYGFRILLEFLSFPTRRSSDLNFSPLPLVLAGTASAAVKGGRHLQFPKDTRKIGKHTSELQSPCNLVCRLLLEKKKQTKKRNI